MRLNDRTVTNTTPALPNGKRDAIIFDQDIPGFGLRIREGGSKTFVFQYGYGGRDRRITLGKFPKLSASAARELVAGVGGLAAKVAIGQDPASEKQEARNPKAMVGEIVE